MKVLLIKMSSLGDVIHTLPLANILKKHFNDNITIDWVINSEYQTLVENNGIVRNAIPFNRKDWLSLSGFFKTFKEIRGFADRLKSEQYDVVLDVQGLLKSALVVAMAGGRHNVGFSDAREGATLFYHTKIDVKTTMHAVEKNLLFLNFFNIGWNREDIDFPIPLTSIDMDFVDYLLKNHNIKGNFAVFCPFSRWETKMWSEERFHVLAKMLNDRGIPVIWTGDKTEHLKWHTELDLTGKLTLKQLYYLMKKARFVVTCDSGAMHLATASGTDIVAIFGPTSPLKTGPYNVKNQAVIIKREDLSCAPCFGKTCNKGNVCLDIPPELVLKNIEEKILK